MQKFGILLFLLINFCTAVGQNLEQTFAFAEKEMQAGNFANAENAYQRVLFFDAKGEYHQKAYLALGKCRHSLERYNDAALSLSLAAATATNIDVKNEALLLSAHSNIMAGQLSSAIFDLLSLPPLSDSLERKKNFYLGVSYYLWNDLQQSESYFVKASMNEEHANQVKEIFKKLRSKHRNPKKAKILSIIVPGAGQLYNGDVKNALNSFLLTAGIGVLFYYTAVTYTVLDAFLAVYPWFQRYYLGGIKKATHITVSRNRLKTQRAYLGLLNTFEPR